MTALVDIVNGGLQILGSRTSVTASELTNNSSNEAIQANLCLYSLRDALLRMAPWNCAFNFANLNFITSIPGTPENTSPATPTWQKGQPAPPWTYEYAYPADCIRPCWIIPQYGTGYSGGGVPISPVQFQAPTTWVAKVARYKVAVDQFYSALSAAVAGGGTGYSVGDLIYLPPGIYGPNNLPTAAPPIGLGAILQVTTAPGGVISAVSLINTFQQSEPENTEPLSGAYFLPQSNPVAQFSTSGTGTGATFNLTFSGPGDQRVILTNQEFAILAYVKQITDPNVMDPQFIDAWKAVVASRLGVPTNRRQSPGKLWYSNRQLHHCRGT